MAFEAIDNKTEVQPDKRRAAYYLLEEEKKQKLQVLADICKVDLIYLTEADQEKIAIGKLDAQIDYNNIVVSELKKDKAEKGGGYTKAAREFTKHKNNGFYDARQAVSTIRTLLKENRKIVKIETTNQEIHYEDFDLMFHLLRSRVAVNNIANTMNGKTAIAKYSNIKEQIAHGDFLGSKVAVSSVLEMDDEGDFTKSLPPTAEELEGVL